MPRGRWSGATGERYAAADISCISGLAAMAASNAAATWKASRGGTAFPIWRSCDTCGPLRSQPSIVWSAAASWTVIRRILFGARFNGGSNRRFRDAAVDLQFGR